MTEAKKTIKQRKIEGSRKSWRIVIVLLITHPTCKTHPPHTPMVNGD